MAKRALCMLLALVMLFSLSIPAFAEEEVTAEEEVVTEEVAVEATEEPVAEPEEEEEPEAPAEEPEEEEEPEAEEPEAEPETAASGTCGDGVSYTLTDDGTLTISGNGEIESNAFDNRGDIKTVIIENSVTGIGEKAFAYCKALTSVQFGTGLKTIGAQAFDSCDSLNAVTFPDSSSITTIGRNAFAQCYSLNTFTIPDSSTTTTIEAGAFVFCSGLTSISLGSGVKTLKSGVFTSCESISSVFINGDIDDLGETDSVPFSGHSIQLTFGPNVTRIPRGIFMGTRWASVVIGDGVETISEYAFSGCADLSSIVIGRGVKTIGDSAFEFCKALSSIVINGDLQDFVYSPFAFVSDAPSLNVVFGDTVTRVPSGIFRYCDNLTNLTIGKNVKTIGDNAFSGCEKLAELTLPDTLTSIGQAAFSGCELLTSVKVPASVTSIGGSAFGMYYGEDAKGDIYIYNPNCKIDYNTGKGDTPGTLYGIAPWTYTIHGYTGSTAEKYAKEYGHPFKSLGASPVTPTQLATPKIAKMENTASGLKVTWNKVSGAVRYMVFYKLKGAKSWTKIGSTTATSYTRAASKLTSGKTYVFTIRCVANDKKTYTSDYDKTGKSLTFYAPPTVTIAKVSNGIKVSWNKIAGSPRYMVYFKENGGGWKKIGTTTATTYTRAAKYLKNGKTYQFTVRCCANDKKTPLSSFKASKALKYAK